MKHMTALGAYNSTSKTSLNQWDKPHTHTHTHQHRIWYVWEGKLMKRTGINVQKLQMSLQGLFKGSMRVRISILPWYVTAAEQLMHALDADGKALRQQLWCPLIGEFIMQETNLLFRLPCQKVHLLGLLEVLSLHNLLLQTFLLLSNIPEMHGIEIYTYKMTSSVLGKLSYFSNFVLL